MQFGGSIGLLDALARYLVIFSHIGHITMAAEAPDLPMGDPDRVEEVTNGLTGVHSTGQRYRSFKKHSSLACI